MLEQTRPRAVPGIDVLPGRTRSRRWPWALAAALAGGAAAAGAVLLARKVEGTDAPGAQEPHELQAVVDRPASAPGAAPATGA